jgi:opacity protein-like surface antigen
VQNLPTAPGSTQMRLMDTSPTATRLLVISLLAALAAPFPARAAPANPGSTSMSAGSLDPSMGAPVGAVDYSALLSLELPPSGFDAGPRFTGELMYSYLDLSPQARLGLGGRASFSYHGSNGGTSLWILEAVPDVKLTLALVPKLSLYGDFGLGLAIVDAVDSTLAATFQFGAGVSYAVTPTMNLLGEMRFDLYTRGGSTSFISFPTVGLQFH